MIIQINDASYHVELRETRTAQIIKDHLPIQGPIRRVGDEIYMLVDIDIELEPDAKEVFEIGDIVYWRSQNSDKRAIALFFGNTPIKDGNQPRAASPCSLLGTFVPNIEHLSQVKNEDKMVLTSES
jgi:uncharacterized protein